MGATAFQRMRREQAAREAVQEPKSPQEQNTDEEAIRAKAKALGIKSWHVKSIETLEKEIAEKEGA